MPKGGLNVNRLLTMPLAERVSLALSFDLPRERVPFWCVVETIAKDLTSDALSHALRSGDLELVRSILLAVEGEPQ